MARHAEEKRQRSFLSAVAVILAIRQKDDFDKVSTIVVLFGKILMYISRL